MQAILREGLGDVYILLVERLLIQFCVIFVVMLCNVLKYTGHAIEFMAKRAIKEQEIEYAIANGETIEVYPDDKPYPSRLIYALVNQRPIHLVLGYDESQKVCYVITAYEPNNEKFEPDFKTRKRK